MTQLTEREYLLHQGLVCPSCGCDQPNSLGDPDFDGPFVIDPIICPECDATWRDVYQLIGYDNLQTGE